MRRCGQSAGTAFASSTWTVPPHHQRTMTPSAPGPLLSETLGLTSWQAPWPIGGMRTSSSSSVLALGPLVVLLLRRNSQLLLHQHFLLTFPRRSCPTSPPTPTPRSPPMLLPLGIQGTRARGPTLGRTKPQIRSRRTTPSRPASFAAAQTTYRPTAPRTRHCPGLVAKAVARAKKAEGVERAERAARLEGERAHRRWGTFPPVS